MEWTASRARSQKLFIFSVLFPILLILFAFTLIPIVANVVISLYNYSPGGASKFILLGNYVKLPTLDSFGKIISNTLLFAFVTALLNIALSFILGLSVTSVRRGSGRDALRTIFFLPVVLPMVAVAFTWYIMYDAQAGIINGLLGLLGFTGKHYWLQDESTALGSIMAVTLWADVGYNTVLVIAGLEGIPKTFTEAAKIDGASSWTLFWKIRFPLMQRTLLFVSVMTLISYFQAFSQIQIMTKGGPDLATQTLAYSIYQYAFLFNSMGTASAMSVVLMVIILLVSIVQVTAGKTKWVY